MLEYRRRSELEQQAAVVVCDLMRASYGEVPRSWVDFVRTILPNSRVDEFRSPFQLIRDVLQQPDVVREDRRDLLLYCGVDRSASRSNISGRRRMVANARGCSERTCRVDEPRLSNVLARLLVDRLAEVAGEDDHFGIMHGVHEWLEHVAAMQIEGKLSSAVDLGERILHVAETIPLYRGTVAHGEAALAVGHALRDQGRLSGPGGAFARYRLAAAVFSEVHEPERVANAELMSGVCAEMSGHFAAARRVYSRLSDAPDASELTRARARLWIGTTAYKRGDFAESRWAIGRAHRDYERFGLPQQLRGIYIREAVLDAYSGHVDKAVTQLDKVRGMNLDLVDLVSVRTEMATAEVMFLAGDLEAAVQALNAAWPLIETNELAHQAWKHNRLFERVTGDRAPSEYERFTAERFRLLTHREASHL